MVGTVKKSNAAIASRWLLRKASQRFALLLSRLRPRRLRYRETVGSEMSNPRWSSSPWMRGAPQVGFSVFMRRINWRIVALISGRPGCRHVDRIRQNRRNPARCQATTVSGFTTVRAALHPDHTRRSAIQNSRSRRLIKSGTGLLALENGELLA